MTITMAKEKWNVSDKRMTALLENGLIKDIKIDNGRIILPDYSKIKLPKENQKITTEFVVKSILEMCNELGYVDNRLMGISESDFIGIIGSMENDSLIRKKASEFPMCTNLNFTLTEKGRNMLKKNRFKLSQLSVGFKTKYFTINAVFDKGKK